MTSPNSPSGKRGVIISATAVEKAIESALRMGDAAMADALMERFPQCIPAAEALEHALIVALRSGNAAMVRAVGNHVSLATEHTDGSAPAGAGSSPSSHVINVALHPELAGFEDHLQKQIARALRYVADQVEPLHPWEKELLQAQSVREEGGSVE